MKILTIHGVDVLAGNVINLVVFLCLCLIRLQLTQCHAPRALYSIATNGLPLKKSNMLKFKITLVSLENQFPFHLSCDYSLMLFNSNFSTSLSAMCTNVK